MIKKALILEFVVTILVGLFLLKRFFYEPKKFFPESVSLSPSAPVITKKLQFTPSLPSLNQIFNDDHEWMATLSAERVRVLIATGDVIPARSVNFQATKRNNFRWPFEKTADVLKKADITLINLESPLVKDCPLTNEGMIFCGDLRHLEGLVYAGVDVANLANNHLGNYGEEGIKSTVNLLKSASILSTGLSGLIFKDIGGVRFAFLGYNEIGHSESMLSWMNEEKIVSEIKEARKQADVIIVSFHWGVEYTEQPSDRQRQLAHLAIDVGADLIIGNHPHWIQPVEIYKNKLITYAHGNFVFDQMWSEKTKQGVVGRYTFYDDKLIDVEFLPIFIEDYGQPHFLELEERNKILQEMKQASLKLFSVDDK